MFETVNEIFQKYDISPNGDEHRYNDETVIDIFNGQLEKYVPYDKYYYLIGMYYQFVDENYEMAIQLYKSGLKSEPHNKAEILYLTGMCYFALNNDYKAERLLVEAENLQYQKATAFLNKHFYNDEEEEDDIYGLSTIDSCTDDVYAYLSIQSNYIPRPKQHVKT
jgi:tetratricopeptide (TPR) repeat protein